MRTRFYKLKRKYVKKNSSNYKTCHIEELRNTSTQSGPTLGANLCNVNFKKKMFNVLQAY